MRDPDGYGNYLFVEIDGEVGRPKCAACGDPVKVVHHSGHPRYAQHCHECYVELRYGKIQPASTRRKIL